MPAPSVYIRGVSLCVHLCCGKYRIAAHSQQCDEHDEKMLNMFLLIRTALFRLTFFYGFFNKAHQPDYDP